MGGLGVFAWLTIGVAARWVRAADLEGDRDFTDACLLALFDVGGHPPPAHHVQTPGTRKRAG